MSRPVRLQLAIVKRRKRPTQQFGGSDDEFTAAGALGCTHAVLGWLAWLWKDSWYSQDEISRMAGYPDQRQYAWSNRRGMSPTEVQRFCDRIGLPYVVRFGVSIEDIRRFSKRGPVGFGHSYSHWPEWKGYTYGGRTSDGRPNGFAWPYGEAGRTQLIGFTPPYDAHFGLLLGVNRTTNQHFAWEPNHGSPSRPERPPFDRMNARQFERVYDSYTTTLGRSPYALIPTRRLPL